MTGNQLTYLRDKEAARHNTMQELLAKQAQDEAARHNYAQEQLGYFSANLNSSTQRYTAQLAADTARENARLSSSTQLNTAYLSRTSGLYSSQLNYDARMAELEETRRHNEATELENAVKTTSSESRQWVQTIVGAINPFAD